MRQDKTPRDTSLMSYSRPLGKGDLGEGRKLNSLRRKDDTEVIFKDITPCHTNIKMNTYHRVYPLSTALIMRKTDIRTATNDNLNFLNFIDNLRKRS